MLEGEGCFYIRLRCGVREASVQVCSVDKETPKKLEQLLGGKIYGPYNRNYTKWCLFRRDAVLDLCNGVYKYLSARRKRQCLKAISIAKLPDGRGTHWAIKRR